MGATDEGSDANILQDVENYWSTKYPHKEKLNTPRLFHWFKHKYIDTFLAY